MTADAQPNPYAPPQAEVSDAPEEVTVEHASRGSRFLGASVDGLIGMLVAAPLVMAIIPPYIRALGDPTVLQSQLNFATIGAAAAASAALWLIWIVVTILFVVRNSQTIGKKVVGIKVARSDGTRASLGRIFWLRNAVNALPSLVPILGYFYMLADHLFIFGSKRQCLHDKIADTIVIKA